MPAFTQLDHLDSTAPGNLFRTLKSAMLDLLPSTTPTVESRDFWQLFAATELRRLPTGYAIFKQGDTGDSAYIVASGRLGGTVTFRKRDEVKTFTLGVGDMVGEISLLAGVPRTATVETLSPTHLLEIPREALSVFLSRRPDFAEVLANLVAERQNSDREYLDGLAAVDDEAMARSRNRESVLSYLLGFVR
ncbi:MAG: cyclic nucleotide-binding domain-containing protein [Geitlerinemataceae cyanobacterium]